MAGSIVTSKNVRAPVSTNRFDYSVRKIGDQFDSSDICRIAGRGRCADRRARRRQRAHGDWGRSGSRHVVTAGEPG